MRANDFSDRNASSRNKAWTQENVSLFLDFETTTIKLPSTLERCKTKALINILFSNYYFAKIKSKINLKNYILFLLISLNVM